MIESTGNQPVTKRIGNKFNLLMESTSGLGGGGGQCHLKWPHFAIGVEHVIST